MAKQKIVVKYTMTCDKKSRKALKIAVSVSGVESASFVGSNKDQIAVTGERIDSIKLAKLLRKVVGHTELVSVGPASSGGAVASQTVVPLLNVFPQHYINYGVPYNVYEGSYNSDPFCTIM